MKSNSYLKTLSEINPPSFTIYDFDGMVNEVISAVKKDPNWLSVWDGELEQNASIMVIEFFSFLFKKNAEYFSRILRENLIATAKDSSSILSILSSLNTPALQNTSSYCEVLLYLNNDALPNDLILQPGWQLQAKDLNGKDVIFEVYRRDIQDQSKLDYFSPIIIPENESEWTLEAFSGETFTYDAVLTADTKKNFSVEIPYDNIIQDSLRIYYDPTDVNKELVRTDSFSKQKNAVFLPDFPNGIPYFKEMYSSSGRLTVLFGDENFGGNFAVPTGKTLRFIGRTGGGSLTNINPFSINTSRVFLFSGNRQTTVYLQNRSSASGGSDRENIEELRTFGPLRVSRERKITDDTDALNVLRNKVQKHKVSSPIVSPIGNTVQAFHYENFCVPFRDFSAFALPRPIATDTADTYVQKFMESLNEWLNLSGIKDKKVTDEFITSFKSSGPLKWNIKQFPPLSGSIELTAYDSFGIIKDQMLFTQNYYSNTPAFSDARISKAESISSFDITDSITVNSSSDRLRFTMNESPYGSGIEEEIILSHALYGLDLQGNHSDLAAEINLRIKSLPFYSQYPNETFCVAENKRIKIRSNITGEFSTVRIINTANSVHNKIGFLLNEYYAFPESGRVFKGSGNDILADTYWQHGDVSGTVSFKATASFIKGSSQCIMNMTSQGLPQIGMLIYGSGIQNGAEITAVNGDLIDVSLPFVLDGTDIPISLRKKQFLLSIQLNESRMIGQSETAQLGSWPDSASPIGPSIIHNLYDINSQVIPVMLGSTVKIEAFASSVKIGEIQFQNITDASDNTAVEISGGIFDYEKCTFDRTTASFALKMTDADSLMSAPYGYFPAQGINYTSDTLFKISYTKETYDHITCSYMPNIYYPTDETKALQDILSSNDRKMMCFLPIFRRVNFIPVRLSMTVVKQRFKSASELYSQVFSWLMNNRNYSSSSENHLIGKGFSIDSIRNDLLTLSGIDGISSVNFSFPSQNITDETGDSYYFLLTEDVLNRLRKLESEWPNVSGISKMFQTDVIIAQL